MEIIQNFIEAFIQQFIAVCAYPINPAQRIFVLYLFSSLMVATFMYLRSEAIKEDRKEQRGFFRGLIRFLFPETVWKHPSAWVDIKYFIPHQLVRLWIYTDLLILSFAIFHQVCLRLCQSIFGIESLQLFPDSSLSLIVLFTLISVLIIDFVNFFSHYLQHKIPFLWEFHRVHHSAEVLHPLTNYREHPVDNLFYGISTGMVAGSVAAGFHFVSGSTPVELKVPILGVALASFIYNFSGYHLRHSHIWVRWPDPLAFLFGCPAHHQIHHSCKREHINKNFAFLFPFWDVLFGTYYLPKQKEEVVFGIGDGTESQYSNFVTIYTLPFLRLFRRMFKSESGESKLPLKDSKLGLEESTKQ